MYSVDKRKLHDIIMESINEIPNRKPGWLSQKTGMSPGFNIENPRHAKAYDSLRDWYHWIQDNYKLRDDIIIGLLDSVKDDIRYGEF